MQLSQIGPAVRGGAIVTGFMVALIGGFEGVSLVAYRDPVGILTVCYGETAGVKPGDRYTLAQCKEMLADSLVKYAKGIAECVKVPLPDKRYAALVSFAYNVGIRAACNSSVVRYINAGQTRRGCDALLLWDKAAGIRFTGLTRRRAKERELCLAELPA